VAEKFNYFPHPAQRAIHKARKKRFRTVCTGRRFGKTLCLAAELLDRGGCDPATPQELLVLQGCRTGNGSAVARKPRDYGWIAPTYNVADRGIEAFREIADGFIQVCGRAPTRVEFNGSSGPVRIWFLSADNPDNIRGFGFQGIVIDEAAMISPDVWNYVLRPTIAQTLGWAVFVSTPKGHNWFYDMYTRGMDPGETDYASFTFPSKASPYFPAKEWEEARRTLPADVFRQEYEAEFLEDSAGVFRNVDQCLIHNGPASLELRRGDYRYAVIGCDVAKHTDWTVLIAMDAETGRCFAMERFNHLDWPIQKERILGFARRYRGRLILDASGVGDPIFDDLKRVWPDIEGFKFTAHSKTELVQRLIVAVEQRKVSWPAAMRDHGLQTIDNRPCVAKAMQGRPGDGEELTTKGTKVTKEGTGSFCPQMVADERGWGANWQVLTNEMKRFEYQISPSGGITYNAPAGYHDDCVMALALANHRRWESESVGRMLPLGGGRGLSQRRIGRGERVLAG